MESYLFIIPNLKIKGSHVPMARLASELHESNKANIYIYNVHPNNQDEKLRTLINNEIKIFNNLGKKLSNKFSKVPFLNKLTKRYHNIITQYHLKYIVKKHKIKVVNSHAYLADLFVYNHSEILTHTLKVSTWHGCYESTYNHYEKNEEKEKFVRTVCQTFTAFNAIIYVTEKQKYYLDNVFKLPNVVQHKIYYGIPTSPPNQHNDQRASSLQNKLKNYDLIFGMVAADQESKGWKELIIAFTQLKKYCRIKAALVLVGGRHLFEKYKKDYLVDDIYFIPSTHAPFSFMKLFDVGILPSYYPAENLPNVILEYMVAQKAVIASNWAEIPYMIKHNHKEAGIIVALESESVSIPELEKAMNYYCTHKEILVQHQNNTRSIIENKFAVSLIAQQHINFFNQLHK
nr:glycosyltransferase family 4 protein [uncultured Carboxylicivirga sp.]